jgi:N-acetylglucosaminyldiphosphoundecaprenol N-acetyl-beta-D-mannosaminyltransferase
VNLERVYVDQVQLDPLTMNETVDRIASLVCKPGNRSSHVVTVNAQFVEIARRDLRFANILRRADLSVTDGVPLVWASRFLGRPVPERVNGTDLMVMLCQAASVNGSSVYLLGGRPGAAEGAVRNLIQAYPGLRVVGVDCPPYGFEQDQCVVSAVADRIQACKPDLLFVGLGAPKQEYWIESHSHLPAKVMIGVGGSFELIGGMVMRAPRILQKAGCEWLWRLCMDPARLWKRYLVGNTVFLCLVLRQWLSTRHLASQHGEESV